jgi:hypothetical protein
MTRHSGKELKKREDCNESQAIAWDMLDAWIGTNRLRRIRECGNGIEFCLNCDLSTLEFGPTFADWNQLTKLVLYAHAYRVRVELSGAAPGLQRVCLHAREATGSTTEGHPGLRELAEMVMNRRQVR